jgi:hypothetical protein
MGKEIAEKQTTVQMDDFGWSEGYNLQGNGEKMLQIVILVKNIDKNLVRL